MITEALRIVDTHTGGEPTRIVVDYAFDLGAGDMADKREVFRQKFDHYRRAIACEPRGSEVMVGALLTEPVQPTSIAGVVFFNNIGYLSMCGHGTMGVAVALNYLKRIEPGEYQLDTPVGTVNFQLDDQNRVTLTNVPSYRYRTGIELRMADGRHIHGDIAWGGNWFYICADHGLELRPANVSELGTFTSEVRALLDAEGVVGDQGQTIDHVELIGSATESSGAHARNFVHCPGGAYDRSPCGTGTCAKLACLAAEGRLAAEQIYRQQSIIGSIFEASYRPLENGLISPTISGQAYVTGEGQLLLDANDPLTMGFSPGAIAGRTTRTPGSEETLSTSRDLDSKQGGAP